MYTIQQFNYSIIKQKNSTISKVSYDNYEIKIKKRQSPFGTARLLSIKLCACRDMVINHEKVELFLALFLMNSGKKHAA